MMEPTDHQPVTGRDLDVVVHGATGFVGRLVAGHLAEHAPAGTRIGLSGRSLDRLVQVRQVLGERARDWPLLVVDSASAADVERLAGQAKVVASTVGPYARHGLPLVEACARAGTHYVDLTGEVLFVRESIDRCHDLAVASGARIVHSCGFDSVPSDLGVLLLHQKVLEDDAGELADTTLVARLRGGLSGGTIDSMRTQVDSMRSDPARRRLVNDPYALSPDRADEPERAGDGGGARVFRDERLGGWVGPFVMAPFNTRVVRRSNALQQWGYGRTFRYRELMGFGARLDAPVKAGLTTATLGVVAVGMSWRPSRAVLDRLLPSPGQGPSERTRREGWFRMQVHARTTRGAAYVATVAAQGDPGYAATAVMLGESALALADGDGLPAAKGVLTPATGIGRALVDRLRAAGFELSVARADQVG